MKSDQENLRFEIEKIHPNFCKANIIVSKDLASLLYDQTAKSQQKNTHTYGFPEGKVPIDYIKENFKHDISEEVKEFLLKYFVINFLYKTLRENKILITNQPNLKKIIFSPNEEAEYQFEFSIASTISNIEEWKYAIFRAPKRKKYKDIDRQALDFIKEEKEAYKNVSEQKVSYGDWVHFSLGLTDINNINIFSNKEIQSFWIKVEEDDENSITDIFLNKNINEEFITQSEGLQEYFSSKVNNNYKFSIKINNIVPNNYFPLDRFKHHFKLKTNKEAHRYLIQAFSYRNNQSQRREIIEELFNLLFSKHSIEVPSYLILRQQENILETLQSNPDYQVYKNQNDFKNNIKELAKKQLKELILIDQVSTLQKINIDNQDVASYLQMTQRPKTKEFLYFDFLDQKTQIREFPIPSELLKQSCLREKTLNYIINYLLR